jgi:cyanophycin synthetase
LCGACVPGDVPLLGAFENRFGSFVEWLLLQAGIVNLTEHFALSDIQMRSACVIKEARRRNFRCEIVRGPGGRYLNYFYMHLFGRVIRFDRLPAMDERRWRGAALVSCKERTKRHLARGGFPVPEGRTFWFWQRGQAIEYGLRGLGLPLVVKPRQGSVARHVTTNIRTGEDLKHAITRVLRYAPSFIVERYVTNAHVYRATVVGAEIVVCARQVPARVIGDGRSTVADLVRKKNVLRERKARKHQCVTHPIVTNSATDRVLGEQGYTLHSVPPERAVVDIHHDPFLALGGDVEEVTGHVHPDTTVFLRSIARHFDMNLVGIDIMLSDIGRTWRDQECAVLELNSVPCIELHHYPSSGTPQNVAGAIMDMLCRRWRDGIV